jgi:hypothetical protein
VDEINDYITVNIEGYGQVKVERPGGLIGYRDEIDDFAAAIVAQTMNLLKPTEQVKRFHPALGTGGYPKSFKSM